MEQCRVIIHPNRLKHSLTVSKVYIEKNRKKERKKNNMLLHKPHEISNEFSLDLIIYVHICMNFYPIHSIHMHIVKMLQDVRTKREKEKTRIFVRFQVFSRK